jgi:DNA-3-methyladenine glycosylase
MSLFNKIPLSYFQQNNVLALSKLLIGKYLLTCLGPENVVTGGMIIETEAYLGAEDKACHAYRNRRTKRTQTMFSDGGKAYVYLCYGLHHLFNIVVNRKDIPQAILIRAIRPEIGIETILQRRNKIKVSQTLTNGPGSVCQALGIKREHDGFFLDGNHIWLEDRGIFIPDEEILQSPRIGVDYAEEDALKPWRFYIKNPEKNKFCNV